MELTKYRLDLQFTNAVLGAQPSSPDILDRWVHDKVRKEHPEVPDEEFQAELDALPAGDLRERLEEQKSTCFFRTPEGHLCLTMQVITGFLKESGNLQKDSLGIKALRAKIASTTFARPKFIPFLREGEPVSEPDEILVRPIRVHTMQGPRVSIAASEALHPPLGLACEIHVLPTTPGGKAIVTENVLRELLDYGQYHGLGQWANGGMGTFEYEVSLL